MAMPVRLEYVCMCIPHWGQSNEVSLEGDGNEL